MNPALRITALALLPGLLNAQDGKSEYETLVAAYAKETEKYRSDDAVIRPKLPDVSPLHAEFVAGADLYEGTEDSLPFLGWLLQNCPRDPDAHGYAVKALDAMAKQRAADFVADDTAARYKESRNAVRHLKYNTVSDEVFARTLLDAKVLALAAGDEQTREASKRSVFKLERLQVGMVAPDIVAKDLDGVEFKLSDYRGKVVVLDFWGYW